MRESPETTRQSAPVAPEKSLMERARELALGKAQIIIFMMGTFAAAKSLEFMTASPAEAHGHHARVHHAHGHERSGSPSVATPELMPDPYENETPTEAAPSAPQQMVPQPAEVRTVPRQVSPEELDRTRTAVRAAWTMDRGTRFADGRTPVYASEVTASLRGTPSRPEHRVATRAQANLWVTGGDPVLALEEGGGTCFFTLDHRVTVYQERAANRRLQTEDVAQRAISVEEDDQRDVIQAYRVASGPNGPNSNDMVSVFQGPVSVQHVSPTRSEAIFQATADLIRLNAPTGTQMNTLLVSGDGQRGSLSYLIRRQRQEATLSDIHVSVREVAPGQFEATVRGELWVSSLLNGAQ